MKLKLLSLIVCLALFVGCESDDEWVFTESGNKAKQFEFHNHAYIVFNLQHIQGFQVVHDPDCIYCKENRIKELQKALEKK